MVLAASSSSPREFLALALVLGAMERDSRLGALICTLTMPLNTYISALAAMQSGVRRPNCVAGDLSSAESDRVTQAWTKFQNGLGRRLRFVESLPGCPENHRGVLFPAAHILRHREELFDSGEVDRCLVVIDELHRVAVPFVVDRDPAAGDDQKSRPATDFEMGRWRFAIAEEVWRGTPGWCGRPLDPVLAVAQTYRDKESGLRPIDIRQRLGDEATAVGLLQLPPGEQYMPGKANPMDLDVTVGHGERPHRIPLLYNYDTCRFWDAVSNVGIGWR